MKRLRNFPKVAYLERGGARFEPNVCLQLCHPSCPGLIVGFLWVESFGETWSEVSNKKQRINLIWLLWYDFIYLFFALTLWCESTKLHECGSLYCGGEWEGSWGEGREDQRTQMEISLDFGQRKQLYHPLLTKKSTFSKTWARYR